MQIHTTKIQKGFIICMPKKAMCNLGFKEGQSIVIKFNGNGICIGKANMFSEIDGHFAKMDEELEEMVRKVASLGKD